MKPLIGISGRRLAAKQVESYHAMFDKMHIDVFWSDNGRRVYEAGGMPVLLPFEASDADVVSRLDGLLITGGQDVHPRLWGGDVSVVAVGADPRQDANVHDIERDEHEISLVRAAVAKGLPVLGICRGNQVLNVALGGTLVEDVPIDQVVHSMPEGPPFAGSPEHLVKFAPGTVVSQLYGTSCVTNSWHHQAVRECGPGVQATSHTSDGSIESIELVGAPVLGVQWHPEWHLALDPVFPWFVEAARQYRQSQTAGDLN